MLACRTGTGAVLLETEFGQALSCCWCPVGFDVTEGANGAVGALAVATVSGHLPIFWYSQFLFDLTMRKNYEAFCSVPNCFDADCSTSRSVVRPKPLLVLAAPSDSGQLRAPIQSLAWCPFEGGNLLAGVVADGALFFVRSFFINTLV